MKIKLIKFIPCQKAKEELQVKIANLIKDFQFGNQVKIDGIDLTQKWETNPLHGRRKLIHIKVDVAISL